MGYSVANVYRQGDTWSLDHTHLVGVGGDTNVWIRPNWDTIQLEEDIVLDGVSYVLTRSGAAANTELLLYTREGAANTGAVQHSVYRYSHAGGGVRVVNAFYPLNIRLKRDTMPVGTNGVFQASSTFAQNDSIQVTAWGHLLRLSEDAHGPSIQPVSVEGYKWPLQRRY